MCVIVHEPKGKTIAKNDLKKLWKVNPDGGGFAYLSDDNQLVVEKAMTFDEYWTKLREAREGKPNRDFLLHMRIATHGAVNLDNTHPFLVNEHTLMAHNGIIAGCTPEGAKAAEMSDTRIFIEEILKELPPTWLDQPKLKAMVEGYIGWSKLMFLTNHPALKRSVYLLNEYKGDRYKGMWMSNTNGLHLYKSKSWSKHSSTPTTQTVTTTQPVRLAETPTKTSEQSWKERNELRKRMTDMRIERGLVSTYTWRYYNDDLQMICWQCDQIVNQENGECACLDYVCLHCHELLKDCDTITPFTLMPVNDYIDVIYQDIDVDWKVIVSKYNLRPINTMRRKAPVTEETNATATKRLEQANPTE